MQYIENDEEFGEIDYIAVLDALEVRPDGGETDQTQWVLDAIPCATLDQLGALKNLDASRTDSPTIDFFLLTLQNKNNLIQQIPRLNGHVHVTVSRQSRGGDDEIVAFATGLNGIDNNNIQYFVRIHQAPPSKRYIKTLEELSKFSHIADSENLSAFSVSEHAVAVAVYDVGQGSMCALVNLYEHPLMFFDLGWPLSFFPNSIPATHSHFNPFPDGLNSNNSPTPVVLSHLDWDHWAYAYESGSARWDAKIGAWKTIANYKPKALARPWLIRRPDFRRHKLGGSHIHFVQTLAKTIVNSSPVLHFWPKRKRIANLGLVTVFACSPAKKTPKTAAFLRNNQGLGMLVNDIESSARVLLAGDADFPSIPLFAKKRLTGLVATHHGGKVTLGSIPIATGHGRMVISAFPNCYPNIPHPDVETEARKGGWQIAYTSERRPCFRYNKDVQCGNRLIRLSATPMCGCDEVPKACLCISRAPDTSPFIPS